MSIKIHKKKSYTILENALGNLPMMQYFTLSAMDYSRGKQYAQMVYCELFSRVGKDMIVPNGLIDLVPNIPFDTIEKLDPISTPSFEQATNAIADKSYPLRDYQADAVIKMFESPRGSLQMATGAGKTNICGAFLRLYHQLSEDKTSVFIVPNSNLVKETAERLESYGCPVNIYSDTRELKVGYVNVTMVQSMLNDVRNNVLDTSSITCCMVDEAHHASAATYFELILKFPNLEKLFGVSGTLFKKHTESYNWQSINSFDFDEARIASLFGKPLMDIHYKDLVDRGYLTPIKYYQLETNIKGPDTKDFHKVAMSTIDSNTRMDLSVDAIKRLLEVGNQKILVFVRLRETGESLLKKLHDVGIKGLIAFGGRMNYTYEDGEIVGHEDYCKIDEFKSGDLNVLIASTVLDEGADIPAVDALVMLAGGKALGKLVQRVGRSVRLAKGKEYATILDFYDKGHRITRAHSNERADIVNIRLDSEVHRIKKLEELI